MPISDPTCLQLDVFLASLLVELFETLALGQTDTGSDIVTEVLVCLLSQGVGRGEFGHRLIVLTLRQAALAREEEGLQVTRIQLQGSSTRTNRKTGETGCVRLPFSF